MATLRLLILALALFSLAPAGAKHAAGPPRSDGTAKRLGAANKYSTPSPALAKQLEQSLTRDYVLYRNAHLRSVESAPRARM